MTVTVGSSLAEGTRRSHSVGGGTRVGDDQSGVDYLVTARDDGFQILIELADRDSARSHIFDVVVPAGAILAQDETGAIDVIGRDGTTIGTFEAPWARDATGDSVATSYAVRRNSIIQSIDPTEDAVYPIVADPKYTWGWITGTVYFNKIETSALCGGGTGAITAIVNSGFWLPILLALAAVLTFVACIGAFFNLCVKVKSSPWNPVNLYSGGYCT